MRRGAPLLSLVVLLALPACTSKPEEPGDVALTVFLDNDVTVAQKGSVEQQLRSMPSVTEVSLETREQAYERLRKRCQGKGDLSTQLQPQMTHESWRFEMPLNGQGSGVGELMRLDGVDGVPLAPLAML